MQTITPDQSRQARRELGLSQADVAEATGFKRQYVSEFESGTAQRFTPSQLRKLRTLYEGKLAEAREAGEQIDLTFGSEDTAPETIAPTIETVKTKRFHFPVDDLVSDDTLASVLSTIRANDHKLSDLLTQEVVRNDGIFGSGDFTEETLQALRDSLSLLACNYLMVRAVSGWPEIGLSASNDNITGNQVLSAILGSMRGTFETAGLIGKGNEAGKSEGVEQ